MERAARVPAFAKINLALKVLGKRDDGYHELRTVFQTVSLRDDVELTFSKARGSRITAEPEIPGNLAVRAAEALDLGGRLHIRITKRIPAGGGLGGGSSDAAAVLLALPALTGRNLPLDRLLAIGGSLGSDVPFFLCGGTAAGVGRGNELYPLPSPPSVSGVLVTPGVHVSTAEAYTALARSALTWPPTSHIINSFQAFVWPDVTAVFDNDFETVVFKRYPLLAQIKRRLQRQGARDVMMSGSGSAVFALFSARSEAQRVAKSWGSSGLVFETVSRARYRSSWRRALAPHITTDSIWPPQSRYAR
jgi:4-diphosphocytidyl-2-C-methyl-D-erythritol kinase